MRLPKFLKQITGISTPIGGVSWDFRNVVNVPRFCDAICLTERRNEPLVDFLIRNDGKLVVIDSWIDASIATANAHKILNENEPTFDKIHAGELDGLDIPLPREGTALAYIKFHLLNARPMMS